MFNITFTSDDYVAGILQYEIIDTFILNNLNRYILRIPSVLIFTIMCFPNTILSMANHQQHVQGFSPDGNLFASINEQGFLRIWDTETNELKQEFTPNLHLSGPCTALLWVTAELLGTTTNVSSCCTKALST